MDTAATLDQYTQDISNLPAELQHLLAELGTSDSSLYEIRKKIIQKDSAIHKFIKQHGSLTKNPKENQLNPKIRDDFQKAIELQKEKCIVANTALFLTSKHLFRLENDMEKLRAEGLLVVEDMDFDLEGEVFSSRGTSRMGTASAPSNIPVPSARASAAIASTSATPIAQSIPPQKKQKRTPAPTAGTIGRPQKRQRAEESKTPEPLAEISTTVPTVKLKSPKVSTLGSAGVIPESQGTNGVGGDEENELYCFCQRVSFGEMVGCDNDDCKYEWFHYECVGLKEPPKGRWYCPDCTERLKARENKKKRRT